MAAKGKIVIKNSGENKVTREQGYFYFLDKKLNVRMLKRNSKKNNRNSKKKE